MTINPSEEIDSEDNKDSVTCVRSDADRMKRCISLESHIGLEDEEEHSSSGNTHACTQPTNDQLGTATGSNHIGDGGGGGEEATDMVNMDYYMERYVQTTRARLKSIKVYLRTIRRFVREVGLGNYSRRHLRTKGKGIITDWLLEDVPRKSWQSTMAMLKSFWEYGVRLDWPVDPKRDLPQIPKMTPRETPPDEMVKAWAEAMEHEPDLELRLYWYGIAEHGWRPSHLTYLEWPHVRWRDGEPWAVVAQSEHFKTMAPLITVLGPRFRLALKEHRDKTDGKGYVFPELAKLVHSSDKIRSRWIRIRNRHSLPHMTANAMRHWVSSAGRREGLSKPALAGMLGHDSSGGAMADWYDNPTATAILEEQENKLPDGMLALVKPPKVEIVHEHQEILELWTRYVGGDISTIDFSREAERLRMEEIKSFSVKK